MIHKKGGAAAFELDELKRKHAETGSVCGAACFKDGDHSRGLARVVDTSYYSDICISLQVLYGP